MIRTSGCRWLVLAAFLLAATVEAADPPSLSALFPTSVADCSVERARELTVAAERFEQWAADEAWSRSPRSNDDLLHVVDQLLHSQRHLDSAVDQVLALRVGFAALPDRPERRESIRAYLQIVSTLIDLAGRLRYSLRDAIDAAAVQLDVDLMQFDRLLDRLADSGSATAATALAFVLFDPPPDSGFTPYPLTARRKVLRLIELARSADSVADLARFVRQPSTPPDLVVEAAELLRTVGLPQDPRPGQEPGLPEPPIVARELRDRLGGLDIPSERIGLQRRRQRLLGWLNRRMLDGVTEDSLRLGGYEVQAGDWLLMRNPSPYNLFTDLAPGLCTHVGVVAVEQGRDGRRRFVLVDLPERGDRIPATNVETYLLRTVNYYFVRHADPAVARQLGAAATAMIGNPSQFDLTFRTDRVQALAGKPLAGELIHTYCAGFLLACAQTTNRPRTDFFPIAETPAGGQCPANLARLGLSIGADFVSPTGALFAPSLRLVGRREPLYSPDREVREAVFDHFARSMVDRTLTPSPDTFQKLRERLAALAKQSPLLAEALAKVNNVNARVDLEAAAKAAAVIESLDEIADGSMERYLDAWTALRAGRLDSLPPAPDAVATQSRYAAIRAEHRDLFAAWSQNRLTPRDLRIALVRHYIQDGQRRLNERFFRSR